MSLNTYICTNCHATVFDRKPESTDTCQYCSGQKVSINDVIRFSNATIERVDRQVRQVEYLTDIKGNVKCIRRKGHNKMKEYIKFEELDNYILKPVYDNEQKRWKVLKGYMRIENDYKILYTEQEVKWADDSRVTFTETLLSKTE